MTRHRCTGLGLLTALAAFAGVALFAGEASAIVKLLGPGELGPGEETYVPPGRSCEDDNTCVRPGNGWQLDKIRIAVTDGDRGKLDGLVQREAPFEVVAPSENPDLVWDPKTQNVNAGSAIICERVAVPAIAGVIDRTAVVRILTEQAKPRPQSIRFDGPNRIYHNNESVQMMVDGVAGRALVLADITGCGQMEILYPAGGEPPVPRSSPYTVQSTINPPYGTDVLVAITSPKAIDAIVLRLKQARPTDPVEFLRLVHDNLPPDARIGVLTQTTAP
jgi:hypothetical protein